MRGPRSLKHESQSRSRSSRPRVLHLDLGGRVAHSFAHFAKGWGAMPPTVSIAHPLQRTQRMGHSSSGSRNFWVISIVPTARHSNVEIRPPASRTGGLFSGVPAGLGGWRASRRWNCAWFTRTKASALHALSLITSGLWFGGGGARLRGSPHRGRVCGSVWGGTGGWCRGRRGWE